MRKNTESAGSTLRALKIEMAEPRLPASVREQFEIEDQQTIELNGLGGMRSALSPQIQFRVEYAMKFMKETPRKGVHTPAELASGCTECSIESLNKGPIPDGDYLIHFDNDGVHHVRKSFNQWVYLAIPSKSKLGS